MKSSNNQAHQVIRRLNRLIGDIGTIRARIEALTKAEAKATPKSKTKGKAPADKPGKRRTKGSVKLVGSIIPYKGVMVKVLETKGQMVKVKYQSGAKKGKSTTMWRAHAYRLAKAAA